MGSPTSARLPPAARTDLRVVALLPAWNAAAFIEPVLRSLDAQTYPNLQVLVSDDASTDDTAAVCERYAQARPRFVVHRQAANRGWIGNVNWLLQHADGDCFFFAFHDDPLEPTYVERLVDALEAAPDAVLAFSDLVVEHNGWDPTAIGEHRYLGLERATTLRERVAVLMRREPDWWVPNRGLFRASAARRAGGLRRHPGGEFSADWPWLLHLGLYGRFVRVPEPLVHKVWLREGLSIRWGTSWRKRLGLVLGAAREIARADLPWTARLPLLLDFAGHWTRRAIGMAIARLRRRR
jgi:glycosyltransferase involved in cell wall biosynthesis